MMKARFGQNHFDFMPETYSLPEDMQLFQTRFQQIKSQKKRGESGDHEDNVWIYKPSQSS